MREAPTAAEMARALADVKAAGPGPVTTTDAMPPGGFTLAGRPARPFSAADRLIIQAAMRQAGEDPLAEEEVGLLLLFLSVHTTRAEIRDLWRLSRTPGAVRDAAWDWAATVPAAEMACMEADAAPLVEEFVAVAKLAGGDQPADPPATPEPTTTPASGTPPSSSGGVPRTESHE